MNVFAVLDQAAARFGDGYISTSPEPELLKMFKDLSGGKPAQAGFKVAWGPSRDEAIDAAWSAPGVTAVRDDLTVTY